MKDYTKKLFIVLAVIILSAGAAYTAYASTAELYVTVNPTANENEYEAVVSISDNPGVAGYELVMGFDNSMINPVNVTKGSVEGMVFMSDFDMTPDEEKAGLNSVNAIWTNGNNANNNGSLFTVLFRAAPSASGTTRISLDIVDIINQEFDDVPANATGAEFTIGGLTAAGGGSIPQAAPAAPAAPAGNFGRVPQTGIPGITKVICAAAASLMIFIISGAYALKRIKTKANEQC